MAATTSIEDRLAIRELQDRYADAVFRFDEAAYAATWTEDAHWGHLGNELDGIANILAYWKRRMADMAIVLMYATAGKIELNGDTGAGRWYIIDIGRSHGNPDMLCNCYYDDVYQKDEHGAWRFKSRIFQMLMVSKLEPATLPG